MIVWNVQYEVVLELTNGNLSVVLIVVVTTGRADIASAVIGKELIVDMGLSWTW